MPGQDARGALAQRTRQLPGRRMDDFLNGIVPRRLGQTLVAAAGIRGDVKAADLNRGQVARLADVVGGWTLPITGTEGFDQAQVTAGGAGLKDFDLRSLESLRSAGLFAAGEVLDVDGDCGGFNLQWAWSSGMMAAGGIDARLAGK